MTPFIFFIIGLSFASAAYVADSLYTIKSKDFREREITNFFIKRFGAKGALGTLAIFVVIGIIAFANPFGDQNFAFSIAALWFGICGGVWTFAFVRNYVLDRKEKARLR